MRQFPVYCSGCRGHSDAFQSDVVFVTIMYMTTRDASCCITSTLLLVLFESEVNMTTTKISHDDEHMPAGPARLAIDSHPGLYRRCGGERADSVDEH